MRFQSVCCHRDRHLGVRGESGARDGGDGPRRTRRRRQQPVGAAAAAPHAASRRLAQHAPPAAAAARRDGARGSVGSSQECIFIFRFLDFYVLFFYCFFILNLIKTFIQGGTLRINNSVFQCKAKNTQAISQYSMTQCPQICQMLSRYEIADYDNLCPTALQL